MRLVIDGVTASFDKEVYALLESAYIHLSAGQFKEGIEQIDLAVGVAENKHLLYEKFRAMRDLAAALNDAALYEESVKVCNAVLREISHIDLYNNAGILLNKGVALLSLNRPEEAQQCFKQGLSLIEQVPLHMQNREVVEIAMVLHDQVKAMEGVLLLIKEHGAAYVDLKPDPPRYDIDDQLRKEIQQVIETAIISPFDPSATFIIKAPDGKVWDGQTWSSNQQDAMIYDSIVHIKMELQHTFPILGFVVKNPGRADEEVFPTQTFSSSDSEEVLTQTGE